MNYRIEILFSGDAPDDELERARILGSPAVTQAIDALSAALDGVGESGFAHQVRAQTIRKNVRKARELGQMRVAGGRAAE